ncbi:MAG: hypothetical protein ABI946_01090 [Chthoniobacterales bacterium]
MFLGLVGALAFGVLVGEDSVTTAIVLVAALAGFAWVALARKRWWLIVPAAAGIGGYFYFGFKIYPHEVALLGAFVPLGLALAVRLPGNVQKREASFPLAMYFLSAYLIAHWIGSNVYNRLNNESGFGNVSRAYFNALWVIVFVIAFWRYGSTKYVRGALAIGYVAAFGRLITGLLTYFSEAFAYIPVVNYVLPGSTNTRSADIRASALIVGLFAICYFLIQKGFLRKSFQGGVFLCSVIALLFGAGRGSLVLLALAPISIAFLYRKVVPILLLLALIVSVVAILNLDPAFLNRLPEGAQRSLSVVLVDKTQAAGYSGTSASDLWHADLRELGFQNWTRSWHSFIFGTGIRPFDSAMNEQVAGKTTWQDLIASSSKVGAYESGWWTVTAVTGLLGLVSYLLVFSYLLRRLVPILWKEKVADHRHAFAFLGVFGIVNWLALGWGNGSFPGVEIMYGFIAVCAFQDRQQTRHTLRPAAQPAPQRLAHPRRTLQPVGR